MILNTNKVTLKDSGLELDSSIIVPIAFNGKDIKKDSATIDIQINFYADVDKFTNGISNGLNVEGFDKSKRRITIEYPITDGNISLYFDNKIKEHILSVFPSWDVTKLVVATGEVTA